MDGWFHLVQQGNSGLEVTLWCKVTGMKKKRQTSSYGQMDGWRLGENVEVMAQTAMPLVKNTHKYIYSSERLLEPFCPYHDTESFLYLVILTLVCTAICICVPITHICCPVLWVYLFIYLFIYSIPKSIYRSSSNGYKKSQRITNLALCNREPVTKIGSLE